MERSEIHDEFDETSFPSCSVRDVGFGQARQEEKSAERSPAGGGRQVRGDQGSWPLRLLIRCIY
jgi:hypothetical protein